MIATAAVGKRRADALLPALRSAVSTGRGVATSVDEASAAADASEEPAAGDEATA